MIGDAAQHIGEPGLGIGKPFAKCLRARGRLVSLSRRVVRRKNSSDQRSNRILTPRIEFVGSRA